MRWGSSLLTVCLVAGLVACSGDSDDDAADTPTTTVPRGVVQTYQVEHKNHVDHTVNYPVTPPVGGDHAAVWQTCGFYDSPIVKEAGVHSMEHGAVWITFQPGLPAEQVALVAAYAEQPYTLASPWGDGNLPAPVVLSAWGAQIQLDSLPDPKADAFITQYRQALSAPEPGAPCDGGTTFTE